MNKENKTTNLDYIQVIQYLDNDKVRVYEVLTEEKAGEDQGGLVTIELNGKYEDISIQGGK